ncbi:hypothetical protein [Kitasatospora sp. HPMI-4]
MPIDLHAPQTGRPTLQPLAAPVARPAGRDMRSTKPRGTLPDCLQEA